MSVANDFTKDSELVAVRLPRILKEKARQRCMEEDFNFSQLMRRALKRELSEPLRPLANKETE
jgi:hypothetical protein